MSNNEDAARIADAVAAGAQPESVPVNVYEADEALVLIAPLPGVMPDDVEVDVEGRSVTIRAAMRTAAPKDYLLHEWHYGPYERTVEVPEGFGGPVETSFGNGQLAVRVKRGPGGDRRVVRPS